MEKITYQFEDFLQSVAPEYQEFAAGIHASIMAAGCKIKIESKASGFFVSYANPKTKRSMLNFLFRKKGLLVRMYPGDIGRCAALLDSLPESMIKELDKAQICKRLAQTADCSSRCVMGYDFLVRGNRYQICRYCLQFAVTPESAPVLTEWAALELE